MFKDFLGTPIKVGDTGIRVDVNRVNYAPFKKFIVKKIDENKSYDSIGILVEGGSRMSWARPQCIIVQGSFKANLFDEAKEKVNSIKDI